MISFVESKNNVCVVTHFSSG